jgi:glycosyltransferase involved in cell wall biosynthesis
MNSPRVSVITATYNRSNVLRHAVESVLWQTFADFEMLVIGDGCADDSSEVVASFGDPRLHWHNLETNSGHQSAPNNFGVSMARGEFIAYLGHDDVWHPSHLSGLVAVLENSHADVAYALTELVLPPPSPLRIVSGLTPSGQFEPDLGIPPSSLMHRRTLLEEIGGWKDYRTLSGEPEVDLLRRAFEAGKKFAVADQLSVFKFNSAFRLNSYVEKPSHEQAEYIRRIRQEPDFLLREFSAIVRSNIIRHPEDVPRGHDWRNEPPGTAIRRLRVMRGLELADEFQERFPAVTRERMDLISVTAQSFLGKGWAGAETDFRWTIGSEAIITFALAEIRPLRVRLESGAFLGDGRISTQIVEPVINARDLPKILVASETPVILEIEIPAALLRAKNRLALQLPNAVSPASLGLSLDVRPLALAVRWMEFQ